MSHQRLIGSYIKAQKSGNLQGQKPDNLAFDHRQGRLKPAYDELWPSHLGHGL